MRFIKPARGVQRVFIHCSASDNPNHDNIETITKWHLARGFSTIGYHFFISKDGKLHTGRSLSLTPAAQAGNNTGTIAICLHGLSKDKFTEEQFFTLKKLAKTINSAYDNPRVTFHGHREVAKKDCPVFDYKKVLNLDDKGYLHLPDTVSYTQQSNGVNNENETIKPTKTTVSTTTGNCSPLIRFFSRIIGKGRNCGN